MNIEGKMKEIHQTVARMKDEQGGIACDDPAVLVLEGLASVTEELLTFMIEIRELQIGSDPGGTIPPGRSLNDLDRRIAHIEALEKDRARWPLPIGKSATLRRIDVGSDDISPAFRDVLNEVLTLRLSEAEDAWHSLADKPETREAARLFASAVRAAVGLQEDLKSLVEASAAEVKELRDRISQLTDQA